MTRHQIRLSRRALLGATLAVAVYGSGRLRAGLLPLATAAEPNEAMRAVREQLSAWLKIDPSGRIDVFFGKTDLAQGVDTAIAQIVADELDARLDDVVVTMGDTALTQNQGGLGASTACSAGAVPLRHAAAEARRLLLEAAALSFGVSVDRLDVADSTVFVRDSPAQRLPFGHLVRGRTLTAPLRWNGRDGNFLDVTGRAHLKSPSEYRLVGQRVPRRDLPGKILATTEFCHHVRLPGMLHARIVRPPAAGVRPLRYEPLSTSRTSGARVIPLGDCLAVVAAREWDAVRTARELRVTWSAAVGVLPGTDGLYQRIRGAPAVASNGANGIYGAKVAYDVGPTEAALQRSDRVLEAEYAFPFHSHARMAPSVAVADVTPERVRVYSDAQKPHMAQRGIAKLLAVPEESVRVTWLPGPGSYGRSDADEASFEAALLSQELGAPIRVQWMRGDGIAWDPKAPAAVMTLRAGLDAQGAVTAWYFRAKGFSGWQVAQSPANPGDTLVGMARGFARTDGHNFAVPEQSYDFPNSVKFWETIAPLESGASPLRCSHMRGPQEPQVQFACESFVDEMAHAARVDPAEFRRRHLTDPREVTVIDAVVAASGWTSRPPGSRGRGAVMSGYGLAAGPMFGTYVAIVCQAEVDGASGRVWVRRVFVAHDCGLVINPLGLRGAIEGAVVQGLSRTLWEEVQFDSRSVTSVDWNTYPILDIRDVPESVEIVVIDGKGRPASGAGEAAHVFVPAAVANAVFDATGVRMRTLPLRSERVRAAMSAAVDRISGVAAL